MYSNNILDLMRRYSEIREKKRKIAIKWANEKKCKQKEGGDELER